MELNAALILEQLHKLPANEQEAFRTRFLYDESKSQNITFTGDEQDVWDAIISVLEIKASLPKFVDSFGHTKYSEACEFLTNYLTVKSSIILTRNLRRALLKTVLQYLVDNISYRMPATPRTMLQNLSTLNWVLDQHYPGYASAGLLHRIIPLAKAA